MPTNKAISSRFVLIIVLFYSSNSNLNILQKYIIISDIMPNQQNI